MTLNVNVPSAESSLGTFNNNISSFGSFITPIQFYSFPPNFDPKKDKPSNYPITEITWKDIVDRWNEDQNSLSQATINAHTSSKLSPETSYLSKITRFFSTLIWGQYDVEVREIEQSVQRIPHIDDEIMEWIGSIEKENLQMLSEMVTKKIIKTLFWNQLVYGDQQFDKQEIQLVQHFLSKKVFQELENQFQYSGWVFRSGCHFSLTDYHPLGFLREALDEAGISDSRFYHFPIKTNMHLTINRELTQEKSQLVFSLPDVGFEGNEYLSMDDLNFQITRKKNHQIFKPSICRDKALQRAIQKKTHLFSFPIVTKIAGIFGASTMEQPKFIPGNSLKGSMVFLSQLLDDRLRKILTVDEMFFQSGARFVIVSNGSWHAQFRHELQQYAYNKIDPSLFSFYAITLCVNGELTKEKIIGDKPQLTLSDIIFDIEEEFKTADSDEMFINKHQMPLKSLL